MSGRAGGAGVDEMRVVSRGRSTSALPMPTPFLCHVDIRVSSPHAPTLPTATDAHRSGASAASSERSGGASRRVSEPQPPSEIRR